MTMTVLIDSVLHIKGIVASKWIFYSCISQHSAEAGGGKNFLTKSYAHHSAQKRSHPHDANHEDLSAGLIPVCETLEGSQK